MHYDGSHEDYLMWHKILEKYGYGCAINKPLLKDRSVRIGTEELPTEKYQV